VQPAQRLRPPLPECADVLFDRWRHGPWRSWASVIAALDQRSSHPFSRISRSQDRFSTHGRTTRSISATGRRPLSKPRGWFSGGVRMRDLGLAPTATANRDQLIWHVEDALRATIGDRLVEKPELIPFPSEPARREIAALAVIVARRGVPREGLRR
jgi:hypothetical protein